MKKGIAHATQLLQQIILLCSLGAIPFFLFACGPSSNNDTDDKGLKNHFDNYFDIGVAVRATHLDGNQANHITTHFNTLTAENAMKPGLIHPNEGLYNWDAADQIADFARVNNMKVRGHVLVWHEQSSGWFFNPIDGELTTDMLYQRMKNHIDSVVTRYKDVICCWDVVNEAVDDDSTRIFRPTQWYEHCGMDFMIKAFQFAREADPDAKLFYNDYNIIRPEKMERTYQLLSMLLDAGAPIDGIGIQGHWSIFEPSEQELRTALERYASLGLEIHITEMDISIYPWEKERRPRHKGESDKLTPELEQRQIEQYKMAFDLFREYSEHVGNVTFWGLSDDVSWLNSYPVRGRRNYPLLFDKNLQQKRVYWEIVNLD